MKPTQDTPLYESLSTEEIQKGNVLIAEFEGRKFQPYKDNCSVNILFSTYAECALYIAQDQHLKGYSPELGWGEKSGKFDCNWAWLMPVIEKISKLPADWSDLIVSDTYYPRTFGMLNQDTGRPMFRFNAHSVFEADTLIRAAWLAVVDFIIIHNERQPPVINSASQ